eukprot:6814376-Prymnesium_polylepis.1
MLKRKKSLARNSIRETAVGTARVAPIGDRYWTAESWVQALELHLPIGAALEAPEGEEQFDYVKSLSIERLER